LKTRIDDHDLAKEIIALQRFAELSATIGLAAGAANVMTITVQAVDGAGAALPGVQVLDLYFSTSAVGANVTATAYSGTLVATTGAIAATITAAKFFSVLTDATGKFVGSLTATGKPVGEYVCVIKPKGDLAISIPSTAALFG
jgi:hypothetical protein